MLRFTALLLAAGFVAGGSAFADTTVNLSGMHLCCGACVKAVNGVGEKTEGVSLKIDKDAGTCAVTGPDRKSVQKVVNQLATAGFYAKSDNDKLKIKRKTFIDKGMVSRLELIGVHNCCGGCNKTITAAIESVDGVTANNAAPKQSTIVVEGNFDGAKLVAALNKAGFFARAKNPNPKKKKKAAANWETLAAIPAGHRNAGDHVIAGRHVVHVAAYREDDARPLVAQHRRHLTGVFALLEMHVAVTDPRCMGSHQHFVRSRCIDLEVQDLHRLIDFSQDGCAHLGFSLSVTVCGVLERVSTLTKSRRPLGPESV